MLDGTDTHIALGHNRSALGVNHVFSHGVNNRLAFKVDALDFVSGILGGGIEGHGDAQSRVQSLSKQGKTTFKCLLFHLLFDCFSDYSFAFFSSSNSLRS